MSYTVHDGSSDSRRAHNQHKIVCFENNAQNNMVTIANIVHLSYVAHADPRMLDVPRLYIPPGSQTAFVRFADAIVMTSLVASQPYEDTITLKDSATNAFIGVAAAPQQPGGKSASLVAMAALGGIMNVDVHQGVVQAKQLSSLAAATARIKSKIEQAVFFGDRSEVSCDTSAVADNRTPSHSTFPPGSRVTSPRLPRPSQPRLSRLPRRTCPTSPRSARSSRTVCSASRSSCGTFTTTAACRSSRSTRAAVCAATPRRSRARSSCGTTRTVSWSEF